jgi:RNA polymerase sigma-70 factor (ECF subfamily)
MGLSELESSISTNLLVRVQGHDQQSWQRLVTLYAPVVYRWCRRWGVAGDDAPDVVQDVFRRVARSVVRFDRDAPNATFRGWLWRIARNAAHDQFSRLARQPRAVGGTDQLFRLHMIPAELPQDDPSIADDPARILHAAISAVRSDTQPRTWDIFWRATILGHDTQDIADDLGMTPKAVRQAKHRVLRRLREECHVELDVLRGG